MRDRGEHACHSSFCLQSNSTVSVPISLLMGRLARIRACICFLIDLAVSASSWLFGCAGWRVHCLSSLQEIKVRRALSHLRRLEEK